MMADHYLKRRCWGHPISKQQQYCYSQGCQQSARTQLTSTEGQITYLCSAHYHVIKYIESLVESEASRQQQQTTQQQPQPQTSIQLWYQYTTGKPGGRQKQKDYFLYLSYSYTSDGEQEREQWSWSSSCSKERYQTASLEELLLQLEQSGFPDLFEWLPFFVPLSPSVEPKHEDEEQAYRVLPIHKGKGNR